MAKKHARRSAPRTLRHNLTRSRYAFSMVKRWLTMPDGTRLATTIYMPTARRAGEQFPVLLELLPYRKDDTFALVDYPTYSYFARRGFMTVKVDIRGTGASPGPTPPREYSDIELDDCVEIIKQLSEMPESNGNVAMWGISWSGFNSIQVAMRRPPQLKAIIAMHASDDLYHDDIHYVDGVLHLDPYHMFINHELALPRTPRYKIDDNYFRDRFNRKPWIFTYLSNQEDGEFWRRKSLRFRGYDSIDIPVYLIGGLLDGYRDTVVRMLENLTGPVRAEIGPWGHSSPDDGVPGPNYEWQDLAINWLAPYVYEGMAKKQRVNRKRMMAFVRDGHEPELDQETAPGNWRVFDWPIKGLSNTRFFPTTGGRLLKRPGRKSFDRLINTAGSGTAAGWWWGETTDDMRQDDSQSLVYDSPILDKPVQIVGLPEVNLKVSTSAKRANWSIRLEDVSPTGKVSLITGALVNGTHFNGRLSSEELSPGQKYDLKAKLHFTTWTFKKGHRIRLAVSNAQFPMAWPSPTLVASRLETGCASTCLALPVVPTDSGTKPRLPKVKRKREAPFGDAVWIEDGKPDSTRTVKREADGTVSFELTSRSAYKIGGRQFVIEGHNKWITNDKEPAKSKYDGAMAHTITTARRKIKLATSIVVESDEKNFLVTVIRELRVNGKLVRRKRFQESIARRIH